MWSFHNFWVCHRKKFQKEPIWSRVGFMKKQTHIYLNTLYKGNSSRKCEEKIHLSMLVTPGRAWTQCLNSTYTTHGNTCRFGGSLNCYNVAEETEFSLLNWSQMFLFIFKFKFLKVKCMKIYEYQTHKCNVIIDRSLVGKQENPKGFTDTQNAHTDWLQDHISTHWEG